MGFSRQAEQTHLPLWEGQGTEPVPNWHPALGFRAVLIRCLISEMFTGFRDSFMAMHGNSLVVSDGVSGLGPRGGSGARRAGTCGAVGGGVRGGCRSHGAAPTRLREPVPAALPRRAASSSGKGSSLVPAPGAAPSL